MRQNGAQSVKACAGKAVVAGVPHSLQVVGTGQPAAAVYDIDEHDIGGVALGAAAVVALLSEECDTHANRTANKRGNYEYPFRKLIGTFPLENVGP